MGHSAIKAVKAYAIVDSEGVILASTVSSTKTGAMVNYIAVETLQQVIAGVTDDQILNAFVMAASIHGGRLAEVSVQLEDWA